jgi:hypothetical protein
MEDIKETDQKRAIFEWKDITTEFFDAVSELEVGELLL